MTDEEATALLASTLHGIAPEVDLDTVDPDLPFQEAADIDSMDFLNLVTAIHDRTGIEIPFPGLPQAVHNEPVRLLLDVEVQFHLIRPSGRVRHHDPGLPPRLTGRVRGRPAAVSPNSEHSADRARKG